MSKHIPGPWQINHTNGGFAGIAQTGYMPHATVFPRATNEAERNQWTDEAEANARLIAAAPDLLKWLQSFVDNFSGTGIEGNTIRADPERIQGLLHAFGNAKAVIAKVEGRE